MSPATTHGSHAPKLLVPPAIGQLGHLSPTPCGVLPAVTPHTNSTPLPSILDGGETHKLPLGLTHSTRKTDTGQVSFLILPEGRLEPSQDHGLGFLVLLL